MRYAPLQKLIPSSSTPCTATASNAARAFERSSGNCDQRAGILPAAAGHLAPTLRSTNCILLERKADRFRFVHGDRHCLGRGPELVLPGPERYIARAADGSDQKL